MAKLLPVQIPPRNPLIALPGAARAAYHQRSEGRRMMAISILVEPAANGYRAITGGSLDLVVGAA
jgi:hypothetical protein